MTQDLDSGTGLEKNNNGRKRTTKKQRSIERMPASQEIQRSLTWPIAGPKD